AGPGGNIKDFERFRGILATQIAQGWPEDGGGAAQPIDALQAAERPGALARIQARLVHDLRPPPALAHVDDPGHARPSSTGPELIRRFPCRASSQQRAYFQCRDLPSAIHSIAWARRRWRVSSVFASVIHSTYSRLCDGLKPSNVACAFLSFFSA